MCSACVSGVTGRVGWSSGGAGPVGTAPPKTRIAAAALLLLAVGAGMLATAAQAGGGSVGVGDGQRAKSEGGVRDT